jgi:cytochrome c oxidase subunit 2
MQLMPESISSYGPQLDSLFKIIAIIVAVAFVLAEGALLYLAVRYRKRDGQKARYIAGIGWKQLKWVFVPVAIVFCADIYIDAKTSGPWEMIKEATPKADLVVRITGQQFSWVFSYPVAGQALSSNEEFQSLNEFHVPV